MGLTNGTEHMLNCLTCTTKGHLIIIIDIHAYTIRGYHPPGENTQSEVPRCHLGQNSELQRAYTQHKDDGGHPKQSPNGVVTQAVLEQQHWCIFTPRLNMYAQFLLDIHMLVNWILN